MYKSHLMPDVLNPLLMPPFLDAEQEPAMHRFATMLSAGASLARFAAQLQTYVDEHVSKEDEDQYWHKAREIFKSKEGDMPLALSLNQTNPRYLAIASTAEGIREINVF